jgi:hypothetical protein
MTKSIARMQDPITKGGQENYKRKTSPVVKGIDEWWLT